MIKGVGIGLRHPHLQQVLDDRPNIDWFEIHSENFFYDNLATYQLEQIAEHYPISLHGVRLSLGSSDKLNLQHLQHLKETIERFKPDLISEHLSWSSINGDLCINMNNHQNAIFHQITNFLKTPLALLGVDLKNFQFNKICHFANHPYLCKGLKEKK